MSIALKSDSPSRLNGDHDSQVQRIRLALGAVAAREPAVFWLFADRDGSWCVRREGDEGEKRFGDADAARAFLGIEASRCASYRLYVGDESGRFAVESFNWPISA